jgi:hypothetical protein
VAAYNELCPSLPRTDGENARVSIRARWRERKDRQNLDWWKLYFARAEASDWLAGRSKDWRAALSWLVAPKNMAKVLEGMYDNRGSAKVKPAEVKHCACGAVIAGHMLRHGKCDQCFMKGA